MLENCCKLTVFDKCFICALFFHECHYKKTNKVVAQIKAGEVIGSTLLVMFDSLVQSSLGHSPIAYASLDCFSCRWGLSGGAEW